jgi:hypothetical protein
MQAGEADLGTRGWPAARICLSFCIIMSRCGRGASGVEEETVGVRTSLLREEMKAIGRGTIELITKGYSAAPSSIGSNWSRSSLSKGCGCF